MESTKGIFTFGEVEMDSPTDKFTSYKRKSDFTVDIAKKLL